MHRPLPCGAITFESFTPASTMIFPNFADSVRMEFAESRLPFC